MKRQYLIYILIIATFIGCKSKPVDCRPFDNLKLEENCAVYFIRSEGDCGDFEKNNKDFVITDKNEIQKIKSNWGFYKTDKRMSCGFGYIIFITQNGKLVTEMEVNEPCGYVKISNEWYDFDKSYYDFIDVTKIKQLDKQQADSFQMTFVKQIKK